MNPAESHAAFPAETAWSVVLAARDRGAPDWEARLDRLVASYWKPVYWHLLRRWKLQPQDAADLAQEFFVRLFEGDVLKHASPDRGRFRTFLKMKLRDLVVDDLRKKGAQKRGGTTRFAALGAEPPWSGLEPEEAFDREWASCLMADAIRTLEALLKERGRGFAYQAFDLCVFGAKTYRECADTLGVKESDVRNWVFAARSELRAIVRGLVRESVATAGDLDEEFAYLMDLFER